MRRERCMIVVAAYNSKIPIHSGHDKSPRSWGRKVGRDLRCPAPRPHCSPSFGETRPAASSVCLALAPWRPRSLTRRRASYRRLLAGKPFTAPPGHLLRLSNHHPTWKTPVALARQLCRTRKQKCDRRLPACNFCTQSNLECRWVTAKQPGLRAGYVSELEKRLSILEREVRDLKTQQPPPPSSSDSGNASAASSSESPRLSPSQSPTPPNSHSFDPLSPPVLNELCDLWFRDYHPWFSILHQPSVLDVLQTNVPPSDSHLNIVFKAIAAVTIAHSSFSGAPSLDERQRICKSLRNEVVMEAMGTLSLKCLQSILIITLLDSAAGKLTDYWNLIALCKRISTLLGLRDLVVNKCSNFNQLSTLPPRMLPLPSTLVSQEENVRAYWMTEVLDSSSTLGVAWNLGLPQPIENALLPCNNAVWSFSEAAMGIWSLDDLEFSSSLSLYVSLFTNELWHVHNFLQQSYDMRSAEDRPKAQSDCEAVDTRLLQWRAGSGALAFTSGNTLTPFDPNILMTRCMFNAVIILIHQRLTVPPHGLDHLFEPWYHAIQRCLESCDDITAAVRSVDDVDIETTNPQLSFCIFVAARFLLVHAKHFNLETPRNLDLLVYALKTSGQRWPVSHRREKVIRTALSEHKIPLSISSLPSQFFDLQYSALDIDDALHLWAQRLQPWVHLLHANPEKAAAPGVYNSMGPAAIQSTAPTSSAAPATVAARKGDLGGILGEGAEFDFQDLSTPAVLLET